VTTTLNGTATIGIYAPDGATHFVDSAIIETAATYSGFFDGNTTDAGGVDYAWTGTANASSSTATLLSGAVQANSPITNTGTSLFPSIGLDMTQVATPQQVDAKLTSSILPLALRMDNVQDVIPRIIGVNTSVFLSSGTIMFTTFVASQNITVSQVIMASSTVAGASLTLARIGLFTFNGATATLVARTASDTTLFTTTNTVYTRSFGTTGGYPATYNLVAGETYAIGAMTVGGTSPSVVAGNAVNTIIGGLSPRLTGIRTAQSDLVTTTFNGTIANQVWGRFS
jgi:hypothetical protein